MYAEHAAAMQANTMLIMSRTQSASQAATTGKQLNDLGLRALDAPVSGGVVGAEAGTMAIMVGGSQVDCDATEDAAHVAENAGLDLAQVHSILSVSAANSWMLGNRGPRMLQDDPAVTSAVDIFVKDLSIVAQEAHRAKSGLPLAAAALQMFLAAPGQGHGLADDSQVIRAYRGLNRGAAT
ncbi:MAG: NAD-binding protein [Burkholderiales bacterium]